MKRISIVCLTGLLLFAACENTNSSTVGTYEKEETSQSSEKSESESHGENAKEHSQNAAHTGTISTSTDTSHPGSKADSTINGNATADSANSKGSERP